jgi:hypothetical protein
MRLCEGEPFDKLRQAYPGSAVTREVADILNSFVRAQLGEGAGVKSLDFLERIRDAGNA